MKHCLNRGILVAIEGIDGVGKTTQSIRLVETKSPWVQRRPLFRAD